MRYILLLAVFLAGCTTRYDAQVARSNADAVQAQAVIVQAQEQTKAYGILAEASKPTYWPIILLVVLLVCVCVLFMWMQHRQTMALVFAQGEREPVQVLLAGEPGFVRALKLAASERGGRAVKSGGAYYLVVDGERKPVHQLTVRG